MGKRGGKKVRTTQASLEYLTDRHRVAAGEAVGAEIVALLETTESTKPPFPERTRSSNNTTTSWT